MDETEKLHIVSGALLLGFVDLGNNEFKCTKDQLCELAAIIAASTVEQLKEAAK